ncbi:MAG: hypothetical protein QM664_11135 [Flavihumibacter sp.]
MTKRREFPTLNYPTGFPDGNTRPHFPSGKPVGWRGAHQEGRSFES